MHTKSSATPPCFSFSLSQKVRRVALPWCLRQLTRLPKLVSAEEQPKVLKRSWGGFGERPMDEKCYKKEGVAILLALSLPDPWGPPALRALLGVSRLQAAHVRWTWCLVVGRPYLVYRWRCVWHARLPGRCRRSPGVGLLKGSDSEMRLRMGKRKVGPV